MKSTTVNGIAKSIISRIKNPALISLDGFPAAGLVL
jgi:hypothetical protein